ncbi:MAG: PHP-associated domain-containing protein, partial [Thermodesulfobacteriota bacterium]
SPSRLVDRAHKRKLDGFAATNHNSVEAAEECVEYGRKVGFPVFRGVEISTDRGHLLVYGIGDDSWEPTVISGLPSAIEVLARVDRSRVAVFLAHPFFDSFHVTRDALMSFLVHVDGVESINGSKHLVNRIYQEKMGDAKVPCIGGSDAHEPGNLGDAYTEFESTVFSDTDLVRELKYGNIRPVLNIRVPRIFRV